MSLLKWFLILVTSPVWVPILCAMIIIVLGFIIISISIGGAVMGSILKLLLTIGA